MTSCSARVLWCGVLLLFAGLLGAFVVRRKAGQRFIGVLIDLQQARQRQSAVHLGDDAAPPRRAAPTTAAARYAPPPESPIPPAVNGSIIFPSYSRLEHLGQEGSKCTQEPSCTFFRDVLAILHINPQRPEWVPELVDLITRFVPNLVIFSLIHPKRTITNETLWREKVANPQVGPNRKRALLRTQAERNRILDSCWLELDGAPHTKVWLMDSRLQTYGDHLEVTMAGKMWPGFTGYLAMQDDDMLTSFWRLADPARGLSKNHVWVLPGLQCRVCETKPLRRFKMRKGRVVTQVAKHPDWSDKHAATLKIAEELAPSFPNTSALLHIQFAYVHLYYVPRAVMPQWTAMSRAFLAHEVYLEWATTTMLHAADPDRQALRGTTLIKLDCDPKGCWGLRYHYRKDWNPRTDFFHPVQVGSELSARVLDWTQTRQMSDLNKTGLAGFWEKCFTCSQYNVSWWNASVPTTSRLHSCTPGCTDQGQLLAPGPDNGVVRVRPGQAMMSGEVDWLAKGGAWTEKTVHLQFDNFFDKCRRWTRLVD
eukprot:TRINITY_DN14957_c0_g1_i1.p1 TRINITY_DN14957_c0_g1~~TRINITY_DN14957_c0_g1_i1.p1  ORF type:complete len:563 (+),score=161.83 TRINITY_DN14957_c0_g1_i1:80-1690(+)